MLLCKLQRITYSSKFALLTVSVHQAQHLSYATVNSRMKGFLKKKNLCNYQNHSSKKEKNGKFCHFNPLLLFAASFIYCKDFSFDNDETQLNKNEINNYGVDLFNAIISKNHNKVKKIIAAINSWDLSSKSAVLNFRHSLGWTPLMFAAINNRVQLLEMLLVAGANPNLVDKFSANNYHNRSRLNAKNIREEEFSDRLNSSADFRGFTALHYAIISDSIVAVKILLQYGADPLIKNHTGHTADEYCKTDSDKLIQQMKTAKKDAVDKKRIEEARERALYPLEQRLKEKIIGQETAISIVSSAIRRKQNGWYDEDHPLVFLFLGSSGIGKTELAKQVANYLHKGSKEGFIRLDMSEYQEKHEVAKLIGSPPGYIGYDQGGQLTKRLQSKPDAVVLFDEVDKAHPDVLTVLLQLFDEGRLTDGQGRTIECKDAVFVMTSNLAADEIAQYGAQLRYEAKEQQKKKLHSSVEKRSGESETAVAVVSRQFKENIVRPILKSHFGRDEFLGRINEFVYFLPFSENELFLLVERELNTWKKHAKDRHDIALTWKTPEVITILADGYNIYYGARSIKYEVDRRVIGLLATAHERGMLKRGCSVVVQNSLPLDSMQTSLSSCRLQLEITKDDKSTFVLDERDILESQTLLKPGAFNISSF